MPAKPQCLEAYRAVVTATEALFSQALRGQALVDAVTAEVPGNAELPALARLVQQTEKKLIRRQREERWVQELVESHLENLEAAKNLEPWIADIEPPSWPYSTPPSPELKTRLRDVIRHLNLDDRWQAWVTRL